MDHERQDDGAEDEETAEPLPGVHPLAQDQHAAEHAPNRVERVDEPSPGGGRIALIGVLQGEADDRREYGAVDERRGGDRADREGRFGH